VPTLTVRPPSVTPSKALARPTRECTYLVNNDGKHRNAKSLKIDTVFAVSSKPTEIDIRSPDALDFCRFVSLLSDISKVATKTRDSGLTGPSASKNKDYPALRIFSRWVAYLRATFEHKAVEDSSIAIFQLLFPELDVNRRYDMQEARLAQHLAHIFGVSSSAGGRGSRLSRWMVDGSSGCLGAEVREVLAVPTGVSASPNVITSVSSAICGRRAIRALI
jgi:hypothetical protein